MLDEKDEEYQRRKERARQLRNSVGMITSNDMQNIGTDNITTINNDNSYIEKLNRAKQLRNSVGFITSNDQMIDEQQNNSSVPNTTDQSTDTNGIDLSKYPDLEPGDSVEKTVIGLNKKDIAGVQQYGDSEDTQKKKEIYNMISNAKTEHAIDTKNKVNDKSNKQETMLKTPLLQEQINDQKATPNNLKATPREMYNFIRQEYNNKVEITPELIQELSNMNDREKNIYIDLLTKNKDEKTKINIKIQDYKQNQRTQKEAEKIDQDIANGNYISSLWHIIKGLPQEAINSFIKMETAIGSFLPQLKGNMSTNNIIDATKVMTGEYIETNSKIKNDVVRTAGSVSGTIGAMIPSIIANIIAPGSGNLTQAVTVGSSEYLDTLNEDNSNKGQALLTGILKGAASYQIEKIAGGNFLSKGSLDDIAHGTIANKFSNKYAQRIASILYDIGGEVAEEQIENQAGYIIDKLVSDKDITAEQWWSDFSETNKNTVLTTIVLGMFGLGGNTYREVLNEKQLKEIDSKTEKSIKEITTIMDKENITIKKPYFVLDTDGQGNISTLTQTTGQEIELKNTDLNVTPVVVYQNGYYDVIDGKSGTKLDTSGYTSVDEAINGFNDKISKASKESIDMVNNEVINSKLALINKFQEIEAYQKMYNNDVRNYKNSLLEDNKKLEEISALTNQIQDKTIYNNQEAVDIFDYVSSYFENMKIEHTNIGKDFLYSVDQNGKIINSFELSDKRYNGKKIKEIINTAVDGVLPNRIQTTTEQNKGDLNVEPTNYIANNQTGLKMDDRTLQNVSSKKVKPYQEEHPELAKEIQEMAWNFQEDLANSIEGKRYKVGDEWTGQKRSTTKELAEIKDETGTSWDKINQALEDIANNKGNYALAKKIELVLDRALTEGYRNIYGQTIFPNESYLDKKSKIEGKDYKNTETNYDVTKYMSNEELRPFGEKANKKGQFDVEDNQVRNTKKSNSMDNIKENTADIIKSIEKFKKAKKNIDRQDVLNIANSLNIKLKQGAILINDTNMSKKAGHNLKPSIIEITKIFENVNNKNAKEFRNDAIEEAMSKFRDAMVIIKDTKTKTEINKSGIEKTFSGNVTKEKIQTADNIKDIIEQGIYGFTTYNPNDSNEILYHHFFTPVSYNKNNGLIRIVIKEFKKDKTQNDKYYYHQLEYISNKKLEDFDALSQIDGNKEIKSSSSNINNSIPQKEQIVKNETAINKKSMQKEKNNTSNDDIRSMKKPSIKVEYDSQGRQLSRQQQGFFKDSKVRDAKGNLMVMYHGTPNGDYTVFKAGSYFTARKEYADGYQNTWASAISSKQNASNPKTYEVYLNITNPFTLQDSKAKDIYLNEFIKGGNSLSYDPYTNWTNEINQLDEIDWTEGEDLIEWLKENHPEYDGLILDEGGDGGYGEAEYSWRGKSFVPFNPNQIKNVDNVNPTSNDDIRYMKKNNSNSKKENKINTIKIDSNGDAKYIDENRKEYDIYFRFDAKGGFKGKEHRSGDSMWENQIDELIDEKQESYYDEEKEDYIEKNPLLEDYGVTQEEYDDMSYEECLKIKMKIADDYLHSYPETPDVFPLSSGASSIKLSKDGIDVLGDNISALLYEYSTSDDDIVTFYTGNLQNDIGIWNEPIVKPDRVIYTGNSKEIIEILEDVTPNKEKIKKIARIINNQDTSNDDILYMKKPSQKVEYDNQGRQLSKQQQKFFKDSKVRDEKR